MIAKHLQAITRADLESLIANSVRENTTLDYKQQLPGHNDEEKKEFLRDVIAFANTTGGDIIFGISERRDPQGRSLGEPEELLGIEVENRDALTLRLEEMIRTSIAPRLAGCAFHFVSLTEQTTALILRIPQSLAGPHMLTFKTRSPFYARNSAGKFELDVLQIRDAFLQNGAIRERLNQFRQERINLLLEDAPAGRLTPGPILLIHTMPLSGWRSPYQVEPLTASQQRDLLWPPGASSLSYRFNFDGYQTYAHMPGDNATLLAYTQIFRNGFIEYATSCGAPPDEAPAEIWSDTLVDEPLSVIRNHLQFYEALGIAPPYYLAISLLRVAGYTLSQPRLAAGFTHRHIQHPFDRDQLHLPELLIDTYDQALEPALKPSFDMIWQAVGIPHCPRYDAEGNWRAER